MPKKVKFVKTSEYKEDAIIESNGKPLKSYVIEHTFQILDEKKNKTKISRDDFVEAMNNYSHNLKPNQVFQIATFFENVGWRSVNSGYMIGKDEEDISKYIFSPEYDDGTYTDLGDVIAFTIMIYPTSIDEN